MPDMQQSPMDPCLKSLQKQINCLKEDLSGAQETIEKLSERVPYLDSDVEVQKDHLLEAAAFALAHSDSALTTVQGYVSIYLAGTTLLVTLAAFAVAIASWWGASYGKEQRENAIKEAVKEAKEDFITSLLSRDDANRVPEGEYGSKEINKEKAKEVLEKASFTDLLEKGLDAFIKETDNDKE